jgi:hypothetical protein
LLSLIFSFAAVVIAFFGFFIPFVWQPWHPVEVSLQTPTVIRVSESVENPGGYRPEVFVQPAFIGNGTNQRKESLSNLTLTVKPVDGQEPVGQEPLTFRARSFGRLVLRPDRRSHTYEYTTDAVVLSVGPNESRMPVVRFALHGETHETPLFVQDKSYQMELSADQNSRYTGPFPTLLGQSPSRLEACMNVRKPSQDEVERIRSRGSGPVLLNVTSAKQNGCTGNG